MKYTYLALCASALLFAACDDNEQPAFSDSDAFVAFNSSTATVAEGATVEIPVTLASLSGLTATASVEVNCNYDNTCTVVEGVNFEIVGSKTLKFDADNRTAYVSIHYIADGEYTGDLTFSLSLKSDDVNVGHENECVVTLSDAEHPLQFILGDYSASADSYFSSRGHYDWTVTISKDASDVSKVYIDGLDPFFLKNGYKGHIYGTVNDDKTQILVPASQSYDYSTATIEMFSTADPDDPNAKELTAADNMEIDIQDEGKTLVVRNCYGIYMSGWYNLMYGDLVLTKQ